MSSGRGIGFIGLGNIGAPMARHLLSGPDPLTVFDISAEATRQFADAGAFIASTPAEVAERSRVVSVMVADDEQVEKVVSGTDGLLSTASAGTVIAIHSTVEADTPIRLAEKADARGVHVVDAPVSGGAVGAQEGTLAVLVGGSDEAVAILSEALAPMADLVSHLGPVGAGTKAKLARNLITFASFAAVSEASRLAHAAGIDLARLGEVVRHSDRITSGPGAIMLGQSPEPLASNDGLRPIFEHSRDLGEKDLKLALSLSDHLGVDLPIARMALESLASSLGVPHDNEGAEHDR